MHLHTMKTMFRVRYVETDQMGVVHHGNYATYFEAARIDWLDQIGISYKDMESNGIMLPVFHLSCKFYHPLYFDDRFHVLTFIKEKPSARIVLYYEIYNQNDQLTTVGETTLVFVDAQTRKPVRCPKFVLEKLGFS